MILRNDVGILNIDKTETTIINVMVTGTKSDDERMIKFKCANTGIYVTFIGNREFATENEINATQ